jgi:hypothetical protein
MPQVAPWPGGWDNDISTRRAAGGPVTSGATYLVGERGPELLTMGSGSGHITPNHQLGGSQAIYLDGYLVGRVMDRRLGDAWASSGSSAYARAS